MTKPAPGDMTTDWPLAERPGFLVRRLHQIHVALFVEACGQYGVTPVQYSLLSALAIRGAADQTTLATDVALDRTTTAGALRRLEARGLLRRVIAQDRRARECRLTAKGAKLLARMELAARGAHQATIAALSRSEQDTLIRLLGRAIAAHADRLPPASDF